MNYRHAAALVGIWFLMITASLISRDYIPIDETRYVTVAWNMWLRGDFLVPYLNDVAYSHKPPMLFWMMQLGWAVFGVNDWWPRMVPSLFALGGVFLVARLSRLLWPQQEDTARMSSVVLFSCLLWMIFATATMFDMLVAFFTLLGMFGILTAWRGNAKKGWALVGLAIGFGLLAKGPTILLQILPAALLAPWWAKDSGIHWASWYKGVLGAILLGAAIALTWAIPAGIRGGEVYQHAIFWGQTADRMVNSFAHQRPFWWYLPLMPVLLFPWLLWGGVWRGLMALRGHRFDAGVKFCIAWALPVFLAFSLISGKQVHYLLPIFPAFALLVARGLSQLTTPPARISRLLAGLILMVVAVGLYILPQWAMSHSKMPEWLQHVPTYGGLLVLASALALMAWKTMNIEKQVWLLSSASLALALILHLVVIHAAGLVYDIRPISHKIKELQDAGVPVANVGKYHGQYQFAGRLKKSVEQVETQDLSRWFDVHPNGRAVFYPDGDEDVPQGTGKPDFIQPYLDMQVGIYSRDALLPPR